MRERMARFMAGRYGNDPLNRFLLVLALVPALAAGIVGGTVGTVLFGITILLLAYVYFRMLSRSVIKRSNENDRYLRVRYKIVSWWKLNKERWIQRKDYKFFTCPSCKTVLRVPRGHGKISIVCRKCGKSFVEKT